MPASGLMPPQVQPVRYIFKQGHADAWLHLYTNGKAAVRPNGSGVWGRPASQHNM